jgi:hypothetical protein
MEGAVRNALRVVLGDTGKRSTHRGLRACHCRHDRALMISDARKCRASGDTTNCRIRTPVTVKARAGQCDCRRGAAGHIREVCEPRQRALRQFGENITVSDEPRGKRCRNEGKPGTCADPQTRRADLEYGRCEPYRIHAPATERRTSYNWTSSRVGGSSTGFEGFSTGESGSGSTGSCGFIPVLVPFIRRSVRIGRQTRP